MALADYLLADNRHKYYTGGRIPIFVLNCLGTFSSVDVFKSAGS
jgi:hypothetical protein